MTKQLLTNSGNSEDSLQPGSHLVEPVRYPSGRENADKQGAGSPDFGYGGSATTDGSHDQRRPHEDIRHIQKGAEIPKRRDENEFFDKATAGSRSVNDLTAWHLQNLPGWGKTMPTRDNDRETGRAYDTIDAYKNKDAERSDDRLEKLKGGAKGDDYGATDADMKGQKLNPRSPVERHGY